MGLGQLPLVYKGELPVHVVSGDELSASIGANQVTTVGGTGDLEPTNADQTAVGAGILIRLPVHLDTCYKQIQIDLCLNKFTNRSQHLIKSSLAVFKVSEDQVTIKYLRVASSLCSL